MEYLPRQQQKSDRTFLRETYRRPFVTTERSMSLFERIAARDRTAAEECLDTYGGLIWAIAKRDTRSIREAEHVTECVFDDIWNGAGSNLLDIPERQAIERITVRCIFRYKFEGRKIF